MLVAVMRAGKLVQVDDPLAIYDHPADRFVGGFIGNPPMNFLPVTLEPRDGAAVATVAEAGEVPVDATGCGVAAGGVTSSDPRLSVTMR